MVLDAIAIPTNALQLWNWRAVACGCVLAGFESECLLDLPSAPIVLDDGGGFYNMEFYDFSPQPLFSQSSATYRLYLTKQNRDRFVISDGCLASGECALMGNDNLSNLIPSLVAIDAPLFGPGDLYMQFYIVGAPSVLTGKTLTWNGPLIIPIPSV